MNKLYFITTAIEQSDTPAPLLNGRFCIMAVTELQAAAFALANQPPNTYIFSIEVYLPQPCFRNSAAGDSAS